MRKRKHPRRSAFGRTGGSKKLGRPREVKVKLKARDRERLKGMMSRGRESVRVIKRVRVLELMDQGRSAEEAAASVGVVPLTARKIAKRYKEGGLKRAVEEPSRPGRERAIKAREEPELVAMLCGPSPQGRARWTVRLASEEAGKRGICKAGREAIRVFMTEHSIKPWREKNVVRRGKDA
jgi:transposase